MGIDFALACGDCLEFIDTHKWPIIEEVGNSFSKMGASNTSSSHDYSQLQRFPHLSNQLLAPVTAKAIAEALHDFVPPQPYIDRLLPSIRNFTDSHKFHFMFITCDTGEQPWHFGEPQCFNWKEIQAEFNYQAPFLPRNLVGDFGFFQWQEVLNYYYYSKHEAWFLDKQMKEEREALKQAFEQESRRIQQSCL